MLGFHTPDHITKSTDINAFIGLASYYHRLIKGYTRITRPLHNLTHKEILFI